MTFAQFPEVVHYQEKTMSESETKGMIVRISAEQRRAAPPSAAAATQEVPFWESMTLDELADLQGVSAVDDLDQLSALWPVDDDPDELLHHVLHERGALHPARACSDRQQIDELSVLCGTSEQHIAAMLMRLALTHAPIVDAVKRHFAGPVQVEP